MKGGCTRSCSITLSSCQTDDDRSGDDDSGEDPDGGSGGENPDDGGTDGENPDDGDNGEDPGDGDNHEEPGDGDGGGEHPGEEDPDGNDGEEGEGGNEDCESCFETNATLVEAAGECLTYEMVVSTNGLCRHELSHWTVALPCGSVSSYSNSEGWPMEIGKDPTTGLYGLKVDEINQFGKEADSFTVRFTLCGSASCLTGWSPAVAYKAGLCVGHEDADLEQTASAERVSAYPNPFSETINFTWEAASEKVNLQVMDQHGNIVSDIHTPTGDAGGYFITLESAHLPKGMYYYKLSVDGQTYRGKISKR